MKRMQRPPMYPPVSCGLWFLLLGLGMVFMVLLYFQVLTVGFRRLGLTSGQVFLVIMASFFGSGINIPIKKLKGTQSKKAGFPTFLGIRYRVPVRRRRETMLAVNVGGCVVPVLVSLYILARLPEILLPALICVGIASGIIYAISRPVEGVGVATPFFAPPLMSALLAIILSPEGAAAPVAYVTGSLGTLLGADVYNLKAIARLGAPVASIGGAGTWDGIFLAGLLASLLAF